MNNMIFVSEKQANPLETTKQRRVWVVSELFYPEETSTGHFLTQIAVGLGQHFPVAVLCSQPTYSQRGQRAPWREKHREIEIIRCWSTTLNRNFIPFRFLNLITISFSIFLNAVWRCHRGDKVLVVTNPPLLPYMILLACRIRGTIPVLLVHDVYPEVLEVSGLCSRHSLLFRIIDWLFSWLYRRMALVIVIGRDMVRLARSKGVDPQRVELITNWADLDEIRPIPERENTVLRDLAIETKCVIQYCGNMGRTHGLEDLIAAAASLQDHKDIHFMMVGSGARYVWLEQTVKEKQLDNVIVLPRCPRSDLCAYLNASDLAVITLMPKMSGISVPSRMYNVMAAGKPILAITDEDSELAMTVREAKIGWVVTPGDQEGIITTVIEAASDVEALKIMGERARRLAEDKFNREQILEQYKMLFASLDYATQKQLSRSLR